MSSTTHPHGLEELRDNVDLRDGDLVAGPAQDEEDDGDDHEHGRHAEGQRVALVLPEARLLAEHRGQDRTNHTARGKRGGTGELSGWRERELIWYGI